MRKIEELISRLQPQLQIQDLLEELAIALLSDLSLKKTGIVLYLPSFNSVQVEAVKRENGDIVKSFRMIGRETAREIEEGMSTLEIPDKDEVLGRIYFLRDKSEKPWDLSLFLPCLEIVKLVLQKARIEWEHKEKLNKITELLGREEKRQREKKGDEEVIKKLQSQAVKQEEDLRKRDEEFMTLFNLSRDGLFIIDTQGNYLNVNQTACELLGCSKDGILRMNAFEQYPEKTGICWKVGLGAERCEIFNREGKSITVELSLSPITYQGRDCFLGVMRGINREEEPGEKVKDQGKLFPEQGYGKVKELSLELFDDLNDAVVIIDEEGIILYYNRKAEMVFGHSREKVIGKSLTRLMPERYRELHYKALKRLLDGCEPRIMGELIEAEGLNNDGKEFPLEFSISPIKTEGGQLFLSIIRDTSKK